MSGLDAVRASLAESGFALVRGLVGDESCDRLAAAVEPLLAERGSGLRLPADHPALGPLLEDAGVVQLLHAVLGRSAAAVRIVVFDKRDAVNWSIRWHQDAAIAVREVLEVPGFRGASTKDGMPHLLAPGCVLEEMVALRVHLDAVTRDGGALRVVPGTHRLGELAPAELAHERATRGETTLAAARGDAILLRPLCAHSSARASRPLRRRVLHVECAAGALPGGLEWFRARPLRQLP